MAIRNLFVLFVLFTVENMTRADGVPGLAPCLLPNSTNYVPPTPLLTFAFHLFESGKEFCLYRPEFIAFIPHFSFTRSTCIRPEPVTLKR
jgi:hypothetical protein